MLPSSHLPYFREDGSTTCQLALNIGQLKMCHKHFVPIDVFFHDNVLFNCICKG